MSNKIEINNLMIYCCKDLDSAGCLRILRIWSKSAIIKIDFANYYPIEVDMAHLKVHNKKNHKFVTNNAY